MVFSRTDLGLVKSSFSDGEEKYDISKGVRYALLYAYACLRSQLSDHMCATIAGNNIYYLKIAIQLSGEVAYLYNLWEDLYNMRDMQQPFNALKDSIILKRCIHYLFYTPTTGLDILDTYDMAGLGVLEPLSSVKQIQVYIVMHHEYISHKCKIHTVDNSKRTLEYIGNTKPGHLWYKCRGETASGRIREARSRQIARTGKPQAQDARVI